MQYLSTREHGDDQVLLQLGAKHVRQENQARTEVELRDRLVDLVSVGNLRHRPEALFSLFRKFLQRISLPRLVHFLDLVLPQLMPVQAAWAGEEKTLWSCHHIRHLQNANCVDITPRVKIAYVFSSHDHIHHVRIQWEGHPLLLFSDPNMVAPDYVTKFKDQASHVTHQQHLQMGLRKGMAILVYYVVDATHYQVVLLAHDSVLGKGGKKEIGFGSGSPQLSLNLRGFRLQLLNPFVAKLYTVTMHGCTSLLINLTLGWEPKALMVLC